MTTQMDDSFVEWMTSCFTLEALQTMDKNQQKVMRDAYHSGILAGLGIPMQALKVELKTFVDDMKDQSIAFNKARLCHTEALILKQAEN